MLFEDAPISCWLAIDSRIVVASIDGHFGDRFKEAGVDGYQFLEKIVQLPFCLPDLELSHKQNFLQKHLEGNELRALRLYKRLRFLKGENVEGISALLNSARDVEPPSNDSEAVRYLVPVLRQMIANETFTDFDLRTHSVSSPTKAGRC